MTHLSGWFSRKDTTQFAPPETFRKMHFYRLKKHCPSQWKDDRGLRRHQPKEAKWQTRKSIWRLKDCRSSGGLRRRLKTHRSFGRKLLFPRPHRTNSRIQELFLSPWLGNASKCRFQAELPATSVAPDFVCSRARERVLWKVCIRQTKTKRALSLTKNVFRHNILGNGTAK